MTNVDVKIVDYSGGYHERPTSLRGRCSQKYYNSLLDLLESLTLTLEDQPSTECKSR